MKTAYKPSHPAPRRPGSPTTPPSAAMPVGLAAPVRLIWDSLIPILLQDSAYRIVDANVAYLRLTGYPQEQLVGIDPMEMQPTSDRPALLAARARQARNTNHKEAVVHPPERLADRSGQERWFRASRSRLTDAQGKVFWMSVIQECTAEQHEKARAEAVEAELAQWFELGMSGMVLFDAAGHLLRTNHMFEALTGAAPLRLAEAAPALQQLLAWGEGGASSALQPGAAVMHRQAWFTGESGQPRRLRSSVRCLALPGGQRRYLAVLDDLSVEEERDLVRSQRDALMDTAGVGLSTFQQASGWVRPPPQAQAGAAAPVATALQSIKRELVLPESLAEYERLQVALRQSRRAEVRYGIKHPEFGQRWLLTRVEPSTLASGNQSLSVITLDVTEQHNSQQRNEQLLREMNTIMAHATVGIAYLRGNVLVRCNQRFEAMMGLKAQAQPGCTLTELFVRHPRGADIAARTEEALRADHAFEAEFQVEAHASGEGADAMSVAAAPETLWYALSVRRTDPESGDGDAIAVVSDITRLKSEQRKLEALARDRELMFSLSGVGIAYLREGSIQRANDAMAELVGCTTAQLAGMSLQDLFADADEYERQWSDELAALHRDGHWLGERPIRRIDGRLRWVRVSKRLVVEGDTAGGIIASYVDVDDRYRAEQAEILQAERTRAILDSVLVGIVTVGPRGIEWMNRSARRMFGGNLADFINLPMSTVATPDPSHPFRRTHYREELVEGEAETFECRVKARDGREFWVAGNAVATGRQATGRQLTFALMDIERRRLADARIAEAQASLQRIIEAAPLAITLRDARSLRVLQINDVAARMAGRAPEDIIGRTPDTLFEPEVAESMSADMRAALSSSSVTVREYNVPMDGENRIWDARYLPLAAADKPPDQLLMVATDVTEQRVAQQAKFEAAIAQREMLVREVHHRIKNNLQGVAGLLQQVAVRKPEVAAVISEVVGQVQAIAQVFGLQVGSSGPLQLRPVVEAITASVQRTFARHIRLEVRGHAPREWVLPEAESIPIALTLNELLTNAVKHSRAGADGVLDAVDCTLRLSDEGVTVEITNRATLPQGFSLAKVPAGVSGLGLVRALLPRRSASLTLEQRGPLVVTSVLLVPPGITQLEALE